METILAILMGIALSAAVGFRVFVPLLVISIAANLGLLHFSAGFEWLGSYMAMITFAVATIVEIIGYYIPWFDNILDIIATPLSLIAGAVVMASFLTDIDPVLKWVLIVVAGAGTAGLVQGATVTTRSVSTGSTGGIANPVLATGELLGSLILSILTVFLPLVAIILAIIVIIYLGSKLGKKFRKV